FRSHAVYLDIETTGGPPAYGEGTVVGLYANGRKTSLVRGKSLTEERLTSELSKYHLVLTFFGSVFDLPYLRAKFPGVVLDHPHIDLCFAARRLGLGGGLKRRAAQQSTSWAADPHGLQSRLVLAKPSPADWKARNKNRRTPVSTS